MTERLELEKRRLTRLEKELTAAQKTYEVKAGLRGTTRQRGESRPSTAEGTASTAGRASPNPSTERSRSTPGRARASANLGARPSSRGEGSLTATDQLALTTPRSPSSSSTSATYKTLMHRLEISVKKLNGIRDENCSLQREVDTTRRQRLQLNSIFERLKLEIRQRSTQLTEVNDETATGRSVQGDAKHRMLVMTRQRDMERANFKLHVLKIREQLQDYDFERKEVEVRLKREQEGVQKKKGLIMPDEEAEFSEPAMMRRIMKTAFLNCIQRRHIRQHEKTIAVFERAFATIRQSTGIINIEEIVKIFVNLESKNYSLLTYVNQMNRDIEVLEGARMKRKAAEKNQQHWKEQCAETRDKALGNMLAQLEYKQVEISGNQAKCDGQAAVFNHLLPNIKRLAQRLQDELDRLRRAAGSLTGTEVMPKLPKELKVDTIPEWLEWIERALGRFRDFVTMPGGESGQAFPATAGPVVKQLLKEKKAPKQLVGEKELPSAISLGTDDAQKRTAVTSAQKAELLDEEADEEDFDREPLSLLDLKDRAKKSVNRKRKKQRPLGETSGSSVSNEVRQTTADERSRTPLEGMYEGDRRGTQQQEGLESSATDSQNSQLGPRNQRMAHLDKQRGADARHSVSQDELSLAFLKRYNYTRDDLQTMADKMGTSLGNLCFLKQEFDVFDHDRSGYIDTSELKGLLKKLGEELGDDELDSAFRDLDADGSGTIEFFEFAEWFTKSE